MKPDFRNLQSLFATIFSVLIIGIFCAVAHAADYMEDPSVRRQDLIDQALDAAHQTLNKDDIPDDYIFHIKMPPLSQEQDLVPRRPYPAPLPPERQFRQPPDPDRLLHGRSPIPEPPPSAIPLVKPTRPDDMRSAIHPLTALDIGAELLSFHYEQEKHWPYYYIVTYLEPLQISHDGLLYGAFATYTHRLQHNQPVESPTRIFKNGNTANFFKVEARYVTGEVDYDVSVQDEIDGYGTSEYELRGVIGYDIPAQNYSLLITPYFGFGYRSLHIEDAGGWVDVADAFWNYDRDMDYGYLPLGLQVQKDFDRKWALELSMEYDWLVFGKLTSHFDQAGFILPGTGSAAGKMLSIEKMENDQDEGFALRASAKIVKKQEPFDIIVEPFIRYWDIQASDPARFNAIATDGSRYYFTKGYTTDVVENYEPKNVTIEYGLRMGIRY